MRNAARGPAVLVARGGRRPGAPSLMGQEGFLGTPLRRLQSSEGSGDREIVVCHVPAVYAVPSARSQFAAVSFLVAFQRQPIQTAFSSLPLSIAFLFSDLRLVSREP